MINAPEAERELDGLRADVLAMEDILGSLTLYVQWRWLTKQLTTEQKERWAAAEEAWKRRLHADDPETLASLLPPDRWWLCPTCGESIRASYSDGPHENCGYAHVDAQGQP